MVDVHCHMLFGVDDGPSQVEESVQMLIEAKNQGVDQVILTPHYREGMFSYPVDQILKNYKHLREQAEWFGVQLYLGSEYHVDGNMVEHIASRRCQSLAQGPYVLAEFSHGTEFDYMRDAVRNLMMAGYIPVVAHAERYAALAKNMDNIKTLKAEGACILLNASSILGNEGKELKRYTGKILEKGLADLVASDAHGIKHRKCHLKECFEFVSKKYGAAYASRLMETNPKMIIAHEQK